MWELTFTWVKAFCVYCTCWRAISAKSLPMLPQRNTKELADIMTSVDAFEHFADPARILRIINMLLQPVRRGAHQLRANLVSPIWRVSYSPFSQWAPLIFSEALIDWRFTFRTDGATRFS